MENNVIGQVLLQVILIALNAVFACAEIAVISMNDNKLAQMAANGDKRAMRLARLTSQPARFLATIQVAITLSGFLGSAFAAENFSGMLVDSLISMGVTVPAATLDAVSVVVITLILSYFTLVFGELVPKRIAMKKAESLALGMSAMITFISKLFAPIVWALTGSTNLILRLFGIDPNAEDDAVSEEEIRMMVDVGSQKGVIDTQEREFIENVFMFDDLPVGDFATHRTEMTILWLDETPEQWAKTIHESSHSLYPVCDENIDSVVGILNAKDYFRLEEKTRESIMEKAVKPAFFVPETIFADNLFKQMKATRNRLAVVMDEYGGVMGIVTINDLLEQLVGDLDEDEPNEEPEIEAIDSGTWKIRGCAPLDEVSDALKMPLPVDENETFSGFVFAQYGSIPQDGQVFEVDAWGLHVKALEIKDHRLEKSIVCKLESAPGQQ